MTAGIWFWILYVISIVFSGGWYWRNPAAQPFGPFALVLMVLIGLLGWGVFGAPIR
jgi:hypothetical protein